MAEKVTKQDLDEAKSILLRTISVMQMSGVSKTLIIGAIGTLIADHFVMLEHKGLPHSSFDNFHDIIGQVVRRHRG